MDLIWLISCVYFIVKIFMLERKNEELNEELSKVKFSVNRLERKVK